MRDHKDKWKINIACLFLSSMIAVYGVELVLYIIDNIPGARHQRIDTRSKLEVIEDLRAKGIDA